MRQRVRRIYQASGPLSMKKIGVLLAGLLSRSKKNARHPLVVGIVGELGAGKTTLVCGFARAFGVKEKIVSPSFVVMRAFRLRGRKRFRHFVHIDCWRLQSSKEIKELGFLKLIEDRDAIILIEWADRIKDILPLHAVWVSIVSVAPHKRKIVVEIPKW